MKVYNSVFARSHVEQLTPQVWHPVLITLDHRILPSGLWSNLVKCLPSHTHP